MEVDQAPDIMADSSRTSLLHVLGIDVDIRILAPYSTMPSHKYIPAYIYTND